MCTVESEPLSPLAEKVRSKHPRQGLGPQDKPPPYTTAEGIIQASSIQQEVSERTRWFLGNVRAALNRLKSEQAGVGVGWKSG